MATSTANAVGRPSTYYPSPFFDVGQTYMPDSIPEMFRWCEYYQLTNPLVATVTSRLAAYPITDIVIQDDNEGTASGWRGLFTSIGMRIGMVEFNLDRYTYGTGLVTVAFPFIKHLKCSKCSYEITARKAHKRKLYKWRSTTFYLLCPSCGVGAEAIVEDKHQKTPEGIRLIRWSPRVIDISTNDLTGKTRYIYRMPIGLRNQIKLGSPDLVHDIPQQFIDAVRKKKLILIDSSKIFRGKRPGISRLGKDSGWGAPLILPVLKDLFLLQVLKKSQEAVALEHIVPMRVLYPQVTTDGNNVYGLTNLKDWQKETAAQVQKWKQDPNHMPVMPFPVGYQLIGGQGRSMLLHQEMRVYTDQIVAGMGVPTSFIYGEAQYTGASVNLRALENEFLGNRDDLQRLVIFVRDQVANFLDWNKSEMSMKPFKMADDIQTASFEAQLAQQGLISKRTVVERRNFNYDAEQRLIKAETTAAHEAQLDAARMQAKAGSLAAVEQARGQAAAQQVAAELAPAQPEQAGQPGQEQPAPEQQQQQQQPPEQQQQQQQQTGAGIQQSPLTANNGGQMVDLLATAKALTDQLSKMDKPDAYARLQDLKTRQPALYEVVISRYGKQS